MKVRGYYIYLYGRDCFIETSSMRRTKTLALKFINAISDELNIPSQADEDFVNYVWKNMRPAIYTFKEYRWSKWFKIEGNGFSCGNNPFGYVPCENPEEFCVIIKEDDYV